MPLYPPALNVRARKRDKRIRRAALFSLQHGHSIAVCLLTSNAHMMFSFDTNHTTRSSVPTRLVSVPHTYSRRHHACPFGTRSRTHVEFAMPSGTWEGSAFDEEPAAQKLCCDDACNLTVLQQYIARSHSGAVSPVYRLVTRNKRALQ